MLYAMQQSLMILWIIFSFIFLFVSMKKILYYTIPIFSFIFFCWWIGPVYALEVPLDHMENYIQDLTAPLDNYYTTQDEKMTNPYNFFRSLCDIFAQNEFREWTLQIIHNQQTVAQYSARSSLFVTIICNSLTSTDDTTDSKNTNYPLNPFIKTPTIRSLGIACKPNSQGSIQQASCTSRARNSSVDYTHVFYNLASYIFNDIINLSVARIYGLNDSTKNTTDLANALAINTFNTVLSIPQQKNYPKTLKHIENNITLAKNIHRNTVIIDSSRSLPKNISDLCDRYIFLNYNQESLSGCEQIEYVNTLAQYNWISVDILYNELFFYNLFNQIYANYLDTFRKSSASEMPQWLKRFTTLDAITLQQERTLQQWETLQTALQDSLKTLNNLTALYPIHVWLVIYQEWLLQLRDTLAKIYLPLHQLHYKLQNVQRAI